MVLGEVVSLVSGSRLPEDVELFLANTITNPIEAHVNGLRVFHLDRVIGDAGSSAIVGLQGRGRLGMAQFLQGSPDRACLFGIEEKCTKFGFSRTGHDRTQDVAQYVNGPVGRRRWVKVRR